MYDKKIVKLLWKKKGDYHRVFTTMMSLCDGPDLALAVFGFKAGLKLKMLIDTDKHKSN